MANQSVVSFNKPLSHLSLHDWNSRINQLRNVADTRRLDSFNLRNEARTLRNETKVQSFWQTYQNNEKFSDRVAELDRWRETMILCFERIQKELKALSEEKSCTESCLESMVTPLLVVSECLTQRDARLDQELTFDDADVELQKELCIVESNKRLLRDQCKAAWNKLNELQEVRFKLNLDIGDKSEAQQIDTNTMQLDKHCSNITFKTDCLRVPRNASTYNGWLEYSKELKQLTDKELRESYSIRESLYVSREKAKNLLYAQQEKTEHTIRKRVFETQRGRNELEWQKFKMHEEMKKCLDEINQLHKALDDKTNALKLAETRLENRTNRSGMELCLDSVYDGLCEEVLEVRQIRVILNEKINKAKATYNALELQFQKLAKDLQNKEHSLTTDIRALDIRIRIKSGEIDTQTARNLELFKLEDQVPIE